MPQLERDSNGTSVSMVVDAMVHTTDIVVEVTIVDNRKMRIFGGISQQVMGCRRLTLLDVLLDFSPVCLDFLVTDVSVVVAHGLSPATSAFRVVELCAGIACSGLGLSEVGFSHLASMEWRQPLADLHAVCHYGVPVFVSDITSPTCAKHIQSTVFPDVRHQLPAVLVRWKPRWVQ